MQGEAIGPSEASLHLILSALPALPKSIIPVFLVGIARLAPTAVGSLDPLLGINDCLIRKSHFMQNPVVRRPDIRGVPLLATV